MSFERRLEAPPSQLDIREKINFALAEGKINLIEFSEVIYPAEEVKQDSEKVEAKLEEFKQKRGPEQEAIYEQAKMFEIIIQHCIALANWLGDDSIASPASDYDDLFNQVDLVVDFTDADPNGPEKLRKKRGVNEPLAIVIDVTSAGELRNKLDRLMRLMESAENKILAKVKHYKSDDGQFLGPLNDMPRVVVSAESLMVKELSQIWASGKNRELAEHGFQFQLLEEIKIQCEGIIKRAEILDQPKVVEAYKKLLDRAEKIYQQKLDTVLDSGFRDAALRTMEEYFNPKREVRLPRR